MWLGLFRYRPLKANKEELKKVINEFIQSQNYEKTYKKLISGDWGARLPHTKSKQQQINLEKHVSCAVIVDGFSLVLESCISRVLIFRFTDT